MRNKTSGIMKDLVKQRKKIGFADEIASYYIDEKR